MSPIHTMACRVVDRLPGVGVGLALKWSRSNADLSGRFVSAYRSGDWARAADLARASAEEGTERS